LVLILDIVVGDVEFVNLYFLQLAAGPSHICNCWI